MQDFFLPPYPEPVLAASLQKYGIVRRLFGDTFEVIVEPNQPPHLNMQRDSEAALACAAGKAASHIRLYSWQPWAVSLGAHQREADIDLERCNALDIDVVRRPTGGRAVLHANELTYCAVVPLTTPEVPHRTIHDVYRDVHIILLEALQLLGARNVTFERRQTDFQAHYRTNAESLLCFSSSARYELVWCDGCGSAAKKVVGSAQRLFTQGGRAVVLQHGSILLGAGHERLADVVRVSQEHQRERLRAALQSKSATLADVTGRAVSFDECAYAISMALQQLPNTSHA
jgi:lipoate-protein ligase A